MKARLRAAKRVHISLSVLTLATAAFGQQQVFKLDPAKTTVQLTLDATLHAVHGSFKAKEGEVRFDPQSGEASGRIVIDATSGETGIDGRDHKMHKDVLESSKYPEISFAPTHIVGTIADGSTVQVEGTFRVHGTDHPLTLSVPLERKGAQLTAKLHFIIPYVDWGLRNPSTFVLRVSKEVSIDVVAVGNVTSP